MATWHRGEFLSLPPPESRLYDPVNNPEHEKLPTPIDERGLVDIPLLIDKVRDTIDPAYEWPRGLKRHHFYWPAAEYPYDNGVDGNFRNLTLHKGLLPIQFENWLHTITLPPPKPQIEVMRYRIEAWAIAKDLFKMARKTVQHERLVRRRRELIAANPDIVHQDFDGQDLIGEEYMADQFKRNFTGLSFQLQRYGTVPIEHRLTELDRSPEEIAKDLGRIIAPNSFHLARSIRAAA